MGSGSRRICLLREEKRRTKTHPRLRGYSLTNRRFQKIFVGPLSTGTDSGLSGPGLSRGEGLCRRGRLGLDWTGKDRLDLINPVGSGRDRVVRGVTRRRTRECT